jgi:hypothetical protein
MDATGTEHSLSGAVGPGGAMPWVAPPAMQPRDGGGSISTAVRAPAATQGAITAAPAPSTAAPAGASGTAAMTSEIATVLAKLDALISALKDESGFLQKVLS